MAEKARGTQIRARAKYVEDGEKSTSYFLRLEKHRQSNNKITEILINDRIIDDGGEILNQCKKFYETLYSSTEPNLKHISNYLKHCSVNNVLTAEQKTLCDEPITLEECTTAINKHMKPNKSPGLDGLPIEFYRTFWKQLGPFLLKVYHESFEHGLLSPSQRKAVITLIYKGNDKKLIKNYRPISLTNCDYKILAFVLASRLQSVMQDLIYSDQSGYIKKRFIGHNIRTIQDLISYAEKFNKEGALLFLDFKKAFDSLEWDFLHKVMGKFNFGKKFQRWVKIFYTELEAIIKNNGWLSENFRLSRGIRQGCPLSALLFIFAVEILAIKVRTDPSIKGFSVNTNKRTQSYRVSQYADDSVLILRNINEIIPAMEILKQFGKLAGLELNLDKTKIMLIGKLKGKAKSVYNIECVNNIKSLGIYVGHDKDVCIQHNWFEKIDKMRVLLQNWRERSLTLFGKVTIIKSLNLPIISFSALHTETPQCAFKSINTLIYRFLWGNRDKIKRTTTIGTIEQGGLGMIDIQCYFHAIKASWINRLHYENENSAWAFIPLWYMDRLHIWDVLNMINTKDINEIETLKSLPRFYKRVIEGYINCNINLNSKEQCLKHTCLWGNEKVLNKQKKIIYFPHWIESGFIKIDDIRLIDSKVDEAYI